MQIMMMKITQIIILKLNKTSLRIFLVEVLNREEAQL